MQTITLPDDKAQWLDGKLVYDSWNEFRQGDLHRQEVFERCEPTAMEFCYWCAIGGETFALKPSVQGSCIAYVESVLRASTMSRNEAGWGYDSIYVIWQPKDHSQAAWLRWSKKWAKRTALTPS